VRARLDEAVQCALDELAAWGAPATRRLAPPAEGLSADALALAAYEAGRPGATEACRVGDARFLNQRTVPTQPGAD
jgi:hydrogenase maturation protease